MHADTDEDRSYYPNWLNYAPFLGRPPSLTRRQWNVLGLIAVVTIFEQYDLALFSLALKQIQAALSIPEYKLGQLGAFVRLGALPAFILSVVADRVGRRQVLLFTIVAYTLLTGATAFSPNVSTFVVLQFLSRTFAVAEVLLAYVVVTEEIDPDSRGWGIGALAALGACGNGLALILFAFVGILPTGWRALYLVGLAPLSLVAWLRRSMPETGRFEDHRAHWAPQTLLRDSLLPILNLVKMYPGRFAAIASVIFLLNFAENAAGFFGPKYLQEAHGWSPWHYSILGYFGGFVGVFGSAYAGRLSDRKGRRPVAVFFLAMHPLIVIAFYQGFSWLLPPLWIAMVFFGIAGAVVIGTFGNELFPTSYRSTASGARMVLGTIGGVCGLWAESLLYLMTGSHWNAICFLVLFALLPPVIVAVFFPETSGRSLEDIAPEAPAAG